MTSAFYVPELKQVLTASLDTTARLFDPMIGEAVVGWKSRAVVSQETVKTCFSPSTHKAEVVTPSPLHSSDRQ